MICFPNAKINIGLNIVEKRNDGFHNIESAFYPINLFDVLEVVENTNRKNEFTNSGIKIPGKEEDNLCYKAYQLISKDYQLPAIKTHLHKTIPIGAGLGGGSSDAAFFVKLLNDKFEIGLSWGEMHHYAKQLGSDCSFFITNKPAFVEGRGDKQEGIDLNLQGYNIALICPDIHINTAEAYSGVTPKKPEKSIENLIQLPINEWKNNIYNDFENSIFPKYPQLKTIKDKLYSIGAIYSSMSGSGSSIYGVFKNKIELTQLFSDCFKWQGKL